MRRHACLRTLLVIVVTIATAASTVRAAETIVGTWASDPGDCTPAGGLVAIGPLSLTSDEMACTFATVSRAGDVVTWHGRCSTAETALNPATVTAALRSGRLAITIDGIPSGTLRRCHPQ